MRRITVMLDVDMVLKLRQLQAKRIKLTLDRVTFSEIINDMIKKGLK